MKHIKVEYIESGTFVGGEEATYKARIKRGEICVVLKQSDFKKLLKAQKELDHINKGHEQNQP